MLTHSVSGSMSTISNLNPEPEPMKSKSKRRNFYAKSMASCKTSDTRLVREQRSGVSKYAKGRVSPTKRKRKP